ncbi:MAG: cytidine deaminase [Planctomycetota bacterium]|nr:cytidine deaminase [Planctomycetota bacterium]MEC8337372.1 cytidine deaminase [Planctomycetota bacterium]
MDQQHKEALLSAAVQASETAYAPYSKFRVGAALLGKNDVIYRGVNVENASYGLTICAERSAVFNAISEGERQFDLIAIASPGGVAPCGACRQVLHEFAPDIKIFLVDTSGEKPVTELSLNVLLPHAFFGLDES